MIKMLMVRESISQKILLVFRFFCDRPTKWSHLRDNVPLPQTLTAPSRRWKSLQEAAGMAAEGGVSSAEFSDDDDLTTSTESRMKIWEAVMERWSHTLNIFKLLNELSDLLRDWLAGWSRPGYGMTRR